MICQLQIYNFFFPVSSDNYVDIKFIIMVINFAYFFCLESGG